MHGPNWPVEKTTEPEDIDFDKLSPAMKDSIRKSLTVTKEELRSRGGFAKHADS